VNFDHVEFRTCHSATEPFNLSSCVAKYDRVVDLKRSVQIYHNVELKFLLGGDNKLMIALEGNLFILCSDKYRGEGFGMLLCLLENKGGLGGTQHD